MEIKIIVKDKKKGRIEIPLSKKEIHDFYQIGFIAIGDKDFVDCLKSNKDLESFLSIWKKFRFLSSDVIYDGRCYSSKTIGKGKNKRLKFILEKKRYYQIKKPKWRRA